MTELEAGASPDVARDSAREYAVICAAVAAGQGVTPAGHVVWGHHNTSAATRVYLDGYRIVRVVAACPGERWVIVAVPGADGRLRLFRRTGEVEVDDR